MDYYRPIRNKVDALNAQLKKQHYTNSIAACKSIRKSLGKQLMNFSTRDQSQVALIVSKNLVLRLRI